MTKGYKILKVSKKLKKRRRVQFDNDRSLKTEYILFLQTIVRSEGQENRASTTRKYRITLKKSSAGSLANFNVLANIIQIGWQFQLSLLMVLGNVLWWLFAPVKDRSPSK